MLSASKVVVICYADKKKKKQKTTLVLKILSGWVCFDQGAKTLSNQLE